MKKDSKIFIAGASGMVGSAIVRLLAKGGYSSLITDRIDLTNQEETLSFFKNKKPEYVFHAAGTVGGIKANNTRRAEFIYDNIMMAANVIDASHKTGVTKLLYTGSSCIYPKDCIQPIKEDRLLTGELETTNEPYAIAKISGIKLCESYRRQYGCNFISVMPTNSYGDGDSYDLDNSHVIPALIRKILTAKKDGIKKVEIWGTGNAKREFIYVDDMADAMIFLMNNYDLEGTINIGTGEEYTIRQLAEAIKYITKYDGNFVFNGELDGTPRKLLDSLNLYNLGWRPKVSLEKGIMETILKLNTDIW